jgi:hypothetical protein
MKRSFKDLSAAESLDAMRKEEDTHRRPHRQVVNRNNSAGIAGVAPCWLHT